MAKKGSSSPPQGGSPYQQPGLNSTPGAQNFGGPQEQSIAAPQPPQNSSPGLQNMPQVPQGYDFRSRGIMGPQQNYGAPQQQQMGNEWRSRFGNMLPENRGPVMTSQVPFSNQQLPQPQWAVNTGQMPQRPQQQPVMQSGMGMNMNPNQPPQIRAMLEGQRQEMMRQQQGGMPQQNQLGGMERRVDSLNPEHRGGGGWTRNASEINEMARRRQEMMRQQQEMQYQNKFGGEMSSLGGGASGSRYQPPQNSVQQLFQQPQVQNLLAQFLRGGRF